ncbi:MAG: translational GTPase TypA [Candidatus Paceibacterota bacterium]
MEIRNIGIIAHVDHGKTTLTDAILEQTGVGKEGVSMDSVDLENERGITIYAKNASVIYQGTKINILDTPGHADFGSEVERVLRSVDTVLLIVDAAEGPMPQTRFVLKKSLELGLRPLVVINKIDKPAADPKGCVDKVLELFWELGATEDQSDFSVIYAIGRDGIAKNEINDESKDLTPLLDTILKEVPATSGSLLDKEDLQAQVFNLGYDNYLGRLAIIRIYKGTMSAGQNVFVKSEAPEDRPARIIKMFSFDGLRKVETSEVKAGDIVMVAGLGDINIGETVTSDPKGEPLPMIAVDKPTIALDILINTSPLAGKEGKFVTARQIQARLEKELEVNVGLDVDFSEGKIFKIHGRGELHIAILLEQMRREGYECQVSQPQVILQTDEDGNQMEPFEEILIDIPEEYQGAVIERLGKRGVILKDMKNEGRSIRLTFEGPTRGILGYRGQFVLDTKGEGIFSSRFIGFRSFVGDIKKRSVGSMVSMTKGKALGFALWNLQERGVLYIGPGAEVYEGMVIGNTSKGEEMYVNPAKGKQLSNVRSSGSDEAINLVMPYELTIERGLEVMSEDEYLEITPRSVRLRKQDTVKIPKK